MLGRRRKNLPRRLVWPALQESRRARESLVEAARHVSRGRVIVRDWRLAREFVSQRRKPRNCGTQARAAALTLEADRVDHHRKHLVQGDRKLTHGLAMRH